MGVVALESARHSGDLTHRKSVLLDVSGRVRQHAVARLVGDDRYVRADLLRTHLWLFLAIRAALDGRVDVDREVAAYEELIRQEAAEEG